MNPYIESMNNLVSNIPDEKMKADYESEIADLKGEIKTLEKIVKIRDLEAILNNEGYLIQVEKYKKIVSLIKSRPQAINDKGIAEYIESIEEYSDDAKEDEDEPSNKDEGVIVL
jgi:hypothetical protein